MAKIGTMVKLINDIYGNSPIKKGSVGTIVNIDEEDEFQPYQIKFTTGERIWISSNVKLERIN